MHIRVLGAHGSELLVPNRNTLQLCQSVGFLVNQQLMIDAGTISAALTIEEQIRIRYVLLSHLHLDHIKGLVSLVDNLVGVAASHVIVMGTRSILEGLRTYIFNDQVFPNFFSLPNSKNPILRELCVEPYRETWIAGVGITPVPVNHTVPTVGFLIQDLSTAWVYSADTYQTEPIWQIVRDNPNVKAAFIETSFPNEMGDLAQISKHLTPALLAGEFEKIGKPDLPVYVYHVKPALQQPITSQLDALGIPNLSVLKEGQIVTL